VTAGQDIQLANGETAAVMSGADTQFTTGGQLRVHSGQAIGVLGGAVAAGEGGIGLQLIAAKDAVDLQAQADILKVQARDDVRLTSVGAHVDWAAAKRITLSTSGGANITIDGGNITIQAPGKITVHAGKKSFSGPARAAYLLPVLPNPENTWVEIQAQYDDAWNTPWPLAKLKFQVDGRDIAAGVPINSSSASKP
jgi:uncharacterized protein (DUF2345 family)